MKKLLLLFILISLIAGKGIAQPFVDVVNGSYQTFASNYKNNPHQKNKTDDYFLNFFLPKEFKNGNTLLLRLNTETMNSTTSPDTSYSYRLSAVSLPVGFKFVT